MSRLRILLFVIVVVAVVAILSLLAREFFGSAVRTSGVIVTGEYVLDGAHRGALAVTSSNITFTENASASGSISLVGENVTIAGDVNGDMTILAHQVTLEGGQFSGQLYILADNVRVASAVAGNVLIDADNLTLDTTADFAIPPAICADNLTDSRSETQVAECPPASLDPFAEVIAMREMVESGAVAGSETASTLSLAPMIILLGAAAFIASAALLVSLFPARLTRVVRAMRRRPGRSAANGVGIFALAAGLTGTQILLLGTLVPLGLVALPLYAIFAIGFGVLVTIGLISLALLIGARLTGINPENTQPPLVAAAVGGVIVALALVLIALQPFGQVVGLVLFAALAMVGSGAALGTRLGESALASAPLR